MRLSELEITPEEYGIIAHRELQYYELQGNVETVREADTSKWCGRVSALLCIEQIKKIIKWGNELCDNPKHSLIILGYRVHPNLRKNCHKCWKDLDDKYSD